MPKEIKEGDSVTNQDPATEARMDTRPIQPAHAAPFHANAGTKRKPETGDAENSESTSSETAKRQKAEAGDPSNVNESSHEKNEADLIKALQNEDIQELVRLKDFTQALFERYFSTEYREGNPQYLEGRFKWELERACNFASIPFLRAILASKEACTLEILEALKPFIIRHSDEMLADINPNTGLSHAKLILKICDSTEDLQIFNSKNTTSIIQNWFYNTFRDLGKKYSFHYIINSFFPFILQLDWGPEKMFFENDPRWPKDTQAELYLACIFNQENEIKNFLEQHNSENSSVRIITYVLLQLACFYGHKNLVLLLLFFAHRFFSEIRKWEIWPTQIPPWVLALLAKDEEIVRLLQANPLSQKFSFSNADECYIETELCGEVTRITPFGLAVLTGQVDLVKKIGEEKNSDLCLISSLPNENDNKRLMTSSALGFACEHRGLEMLTAVFAVLKTRYPENLPQKIQPSLLLALRDIIEVDLSSNTDEPEDFIDEKDRLEKLKFLIENGANPFYVDFNNDFNSFKVLLSGVCYYSTDFIRAAYKILFEKYPGDPKSDPKYLEVCQSALNELNSESLEYCLEKTEKEKFLLALGATPTNPPNKKEKSVSFASHVAASSSPVFALQVQQEQKVPLQTRTDTDMPDATPRNGLN